MSYCALFDGAEVYHGPTCLCEPCADRRVAFALQPEIDYMLSVTPDIFTRPIRYRIARVNP